MEGFEVTTSEGDSVGHVVAQVGDNLILEHGLRRRRHALPLEFVEIDDGERVGRTTLSKELIATMGDLRSVGVVILTLGQYLRPSREHLPVARYYHPDEFAELAEIGRSLGFAHVESGPLVRSSYHAKRQDRIATGEDAHVGATPRLSCSHSRPEPASPSPLH